MSLALKTDVTGYAKNNIRNAVSYALNSAVSHAYQRFGHYEKLCKQFETKYHLTSEQFIEQFDSGQLGDDQDFFDWHAAKRGLDIWRERYEILSGVSV